MIFLTVGTQLHFDRMLAVVDAWAENRNVEVIAQTGEDSSYQPRCIKATPFLTPERFVEIYKEADFIVAHAGMGSILTALQYSKPILVMPRKASLGEHRNEHQLATVKYLSGTPGLEIAMDDDELREKLDHMSELSEYQGISEEAPQQIIDTLRDFILNGKKPA